MYRLGWKQFVPFIVTIVGIVFTDLLVGIGMGLMVGVTIILIKSYQNSHFLHIQNKSNGKNEVVMRLAEEVTFINKGAILKELELLPNDCILELEVTKTIYLDNDVIEILDNFLEKAKTRNIEIIVLSEQGKFSQPKSFAFLFNPKKKTA
jgi:MFS superfamily sulfate permease-like transporter